MGSTNYGNQTIYTIYAQDATSSNFNKRFSKIVQEGVYDGGTLCIDSGDDILIGVFTAYARSSSGEAVKIETSSTVSVTLAEATPYVIGRFVWANNASNYLDFYAVASGDIASNDIVFGKGVYVGGVLTSFDYDDKTYGLIDSDKNVYISGNLYVDDILEKTTGNGIHIDDIHIIDNTLSGTTGLGVDIEDININGSTISGTTTFTSIPVLPASDPTTDNQALRLGTFVDYNNPGVLRNAIINGRGLVSQRASSHSYADGDDGYKCVDRWPLYIGSSSAVINMSKVTNGGIRLECTTADTSVDSTHYIQLSQKIEGYNFVPFVGKTALMSFKIKSNMTDATFCIFLKNNGNG